METFGILLCNALEKNYIYIVLKGGKVFEFNFNDQNLRQIFQAEDIQTIQETEAAYMKILESSQTLLHVLKREQTKIGKKH